MKYLTMLIVLFGCILTLPVSAEDDKSITVEFIWGIGETTAHKGFVLRASQDSGKTAGEIHIAHWFGAGSNTALGVGLTARTEKDGQTGNKLYHASGTIGLSYVFQTDTVFSNHFQPYFRVAVGTDVDSDGDAEIELSYSRYGLENAEQFGGFGLRVNNRYELLKSKPSNKPDDDDGNNGHGDDDDNCDESNPGDNDCDGNG